MKAALAITSGCMLIFIFTSFQPKEKWTNLLDKNLSRWDIYQSYRHTEKYDGTPPTDEKGNLIPPIGYNKNEADVFKTIMENGETVLKISGEVYGCVFTKQEFENYHLKLKVRWGNKKWEPRTSKLKDSGILYHSIGAYGADYWRAWMLSQELQIMQGHIGDYWNIANSAIDIRAYIPEGKMNTVASDKQPFVGVGTGTNLDGFCLRSADYESPNGQWTTVELICFGDKSLHIVNGHVVMILQNSRYVADGKSIPLTKGKIQLQSEAAEVFYKDIQIKNISALPAEYAVYFK
jgi:Domain of Unknown Function (DUF1080)